MSAVLGTKNTAENMILSLTELSDVRTGYILLFSIFYIVSIAFKRLSDITSHQLGFNDILL